MKRYCGLDVHKDSVFMCIIDESGFKKEQKFTTLTSNLYQMCACMRSFSVSEVAIESTSIYWIFIWRLLIAEFDVKLVNPLFIKQLPGRKTDIKDAHWIATVLMKGLVYGSYVPDQSIQALLLVIKESLNGVLEQVDIDMLKLQVEELELHEKHQHECLMKMVEICDTSYADLQGLLVTIPGIGKQSAMAILSELGNDLSNFKTSSSLVGWAGLRPRNEESAGRIKSHKTMHGNKFLRVILVQCAWAASRTKDSRLGVKYRELKSRMSPQKALVAIARRLLVIIWNVITKKEKYRISAA